MYADIAKLTDRLNKLRCSDWNPSTNVPAVGVVKQDDHDASQGTQEIDFVESVCVQLSSPLSPYNHLAFTGRSSYTALLCNPLMYRHNPQGFPLQAL